MKKITLPAIALLSLALLAGCNNGATNNVMDSTHQETETPAEETAAVEVEVDIADTAAVQIEATAEKAAPAYLNESPEYLAYSENKYNELLGNKPFVISFHADWCPTCRQLDSNISADISNFPDGTKILKANYDTAAELKKKYKINSQSTLAVVDAEGNHTKTLVAPKNSEIINAINNSL